MKNRLITTLLFISSTVMFSQCFTKLNSGYAHVSAIKGDGSCWIWGVGGYGQLGTGNEDTLLSPLLINNTNGAITIQLGRDNSCLIRQNGTLWSTGSNLYGQLGIGSTLEYVNVFTQVGTETNWKAVCPGDFTIAMKTDNTLWGWGQNDGYQVGDGTTIERNTPVQISTATDWKSIATSDVRSGFALKNNGTLWAWGMNLNSYLLGDSSVTFLPVPTQRFPDTDWDKLELGDEHALAIKINGTLWCWGTAINGETGQDPAGGTITLSQPHQIPGTWIKATGGFRFSMGIKSDGTLWGWGNNEAGQLGRGTTSLINFTPVQVGTATNWVDVSCGYQHTLALRSDGSLWAWGDNTYGQLGNGGAVPSTLTPLAIPVAGCTLGTEEFAANANAVSISPNPVQSELSLQYKGNEVITTIVVYDLQGREVYSTPAIGNNAFAATFSIANLSNGGYIVSLLNENKTVVSKQFVKE
jgi:alpha-tubulin suppressor-like RCC1 family protein